MDFSELARYFNELDKTASRNSMTEILAELLKNVLDEEVKRVCYLSLGQLGSHYDKVDFQLADKMVIRAIASAIGVEVSEVLGDYKRVGDLGTVINSYKLQTTNYKNISIYDVYDRLLKIARDGGQGSQERKINLLAELLKEVDALSSKYVVRMVLGRLRLGFSDKTMLDALSVMDGGSKSGRVELDEAYQVFPDIGEIAYLVKKYGLKGISKRVDVTLGIPVMPALCQRLKTAEEMIEKMGEVMVEPKFDGTRVQIHVKKQGEWKVKTFTRNLEETTNMFPELVDALEQINANEVILDCEAVGMDPNTGKMLPFQVTITRKRKHGVEEALRTVPLVFNVFDVLYVDGKSLIGMPLRQRREVLKTIINKGKLLAIDEVLITKNADELRNFHAQKLSQGFEGVVIKQIDSFYDPGRRGWSWVKFKESEESAAKLSDTIDAVVMGFYRGKGKRAGFGIGAFLVGVKDGDRVKTIAKIGTGLSDEQWKDLRKRLEQNVAMDKPDEYVVDKNLAPDVWVDPVVVVEIAADEITKSPIHSAGYALRFPRLISFRDDKNFSQATSIEELDRIRG